LLEHPDVQSGNINIQWLESHLDELTGLSANDETIQLAAIVAALAAQQDREVRIPTANDDELNDASERSGWRAVARRESLRRE